MHFSTGGRALMLYCVLWFLITNVEYSWNTLFALCIASVGCGIARVSCGIAGVDTPGLVCSALFMVVMRLLCCSVLYYLRFNTNAISGNSVAFRQARTIYAHCAPY